MCSERSRSSLNSPRSSSRRRSILSPSSTERNSRSEISRRPSSSMMCRSLSSTSRWPSSSITWRSCSSISRRSPSAMAWPGMGAKKAVNATAASRPRHELVSTFIFVSPIARLAPGRTGFLQKPTTAVIMADCEGRLRERNTRFPRFFREFGGLRRPGNDAKAPCPARSGSFPGGIACRRWEAACGGCP